MIFLKKRDLNAGFQIKKHRLLFVCTLLLGCKSLVYQPFMIDKNFDWQGHRGARGLMPENIVSGFLLALDLGVKTLEMDLCVSKDNILVVSHEPYMSAEICTDAKENLITAADEQQKFALYQMPITEIQACDCGSLKHPRFPFQKKQKAYKPTLVEVVATVRAYCVQKNIPMPYFNLEIKSKPAWDGLLTPSVADFAKLVLDDVNRMEINDLTIIQSFDPRALEAIKKLDKNIKTALLIENIEEVKENLNKLSFKPDIYSPSFKLVNLSTVQYCHQRQIRVIPWTVNDTTDMIALIRLGVDGIITDYPNKILRK